MSQQLDQNWFGPRNLAHSLKNSSRWSIEVNTTFGKRNNRSYIEIQVNSAENQKKQQHRLNRCPSIGASDAWRKFRRPVGLSLWMLAEIKSANYIAPVEPMVPRKAPVHQTSFVPESMFRWTSTSLQHRLNRHFGIKAPVHQTPYVPESLFELISEPLQHRLNRCPYGACTGAMTQAWILCQKPQRLLIGHRETG